MKGRIEFEYDQVNDLVVATPRWVIETEADVAEWHDQYVSYMQPFKLRPPRRSACAGPPP
jgi:hypothetical protein